MEWRQQLDFRADATGGFRVAFANCQSGVDLAASAFDVSEGRYVRHRLAPYSERFFDAAFERRLLTGAYADEPPSPRFPDQPRIQLLSSSANVRAATSGDMLFRARPRYVDTETRLLVSGRLDRGVLAVGLQKDGVWATRVDVTDTGAFTVLLAPASNGAYSPAVAAATPGGDVVASLTRVDLLPAIRPAK